MVARWETWTAANMLITARGQVAEEHAEEQIAQAMATGSEGDEAVWRAIAQHIEEIRAERREAD